MEIYGFPSCLENLESLATVNTSSTGLVDDMHTEQFAPDHWPLSCTLPPPSAFASVIFTCYGVLILFHRACRALKCFT